METNKSAILVPAQKDEALKEIKYKPNQFSAGHRLRNFITSIFLLAYGTYGLWINDLYIPGKRTKGVHLHDLSAWVMYGAFVSACFVMFSVIVDHYDTRDNEIKYQRFAGIFERVAWFFFLLSVCVRITNFDGSLKSAALLAVVFAGASLLFLWFFRLSEKKAQKDKQQIEIWNEAERIDLAAFAAHSDIHRYALNGRDAKKMQYIEEPRYVEGELQALTVKRVLRNEAGEYFYWIWSSDSPHYIKHITQVNAKIVLKTEYLKP